MLRNGGKRCFKEIHLLKIVKKIYPFLSGLDLENIMENS